MPDRQSSRWLAGRYQNRRQPCATPLMAVLSIYFVSVMGLDAEVRTAVSGRRAGLRPDLDAAYYMIRTYLVSRRGGGGRVVGGAPGTRGAGGGPRAGVRPGTHGAPGTGVGVWL